MNGVNPSLDVIARAKGQVDVPPEDVVRETAWRLDLARYKEANPTLPVPPMLVGIAGKYGSGKSSIICYLVSQLRRYNLFHKVYYFSDSGQLDAKMKEFLPVDNENFHYSPENISTLLGEAYKNKGEKPPWEGGSGRKIPLNAPTKTMGAGPTRKGTILTSGGINRGLPGKIRTDGPEVRHALATRHIKPGAMHPMPGSDRAGAVLPLKERLAKERGRVSNKILYIFDDATGHTILKNAREGNPWAPFFTSLRHLGASVIACYHEYKALGTLQRNNMSATVTFKAGNPEELKKIAHESEMSKDSYELLMRAVSRIPHAFLGTHRDARPEAERFVLNFQRVIEPAVMEEVVRRERELAKSLRDAGGEEDIRAVFGLGQDAGGTAVLPSVEPLACAMRPDLLGDVSYAPPGLTPREAAALPEARTLIASVEALTRPNEPDPDRMARELGITRQAPRRSPPARRDGGGGKRQKTTTTTTGEVQTATPQVVPTTNNGGSARDHNSSMATVRQSSALAMRKPTSVQARESVRAISGARAVIGHILRTATAGTARAERAAVAAGLRTAASQQLEAGNTPAVQALIKRLRVVRSGRAPRGVVASIGRGVGVNLNKVTFRTDSSATRAAILPGILRGPRDGIRRSIRGAGAGARIAVERSARQAQTEATLLGIRQELERFKRPPAEEAAKQFEIDRIKLQNQAKLEIEKDALQREVRTANEQAARDAAAAGRETTQDQLTRMGQQVRLLQTQADLKTATKKAEGPTDNEQRTEREQQRAAAVRASTDANVATATAPFQPRREAFVSAEQLVSAREGLRTTRATAAQKTEIARAEASGTADRTRIFAELAAPIASAQGQAQLARAETERALALRTLQEASTEPAEEIEVESTAPIDPLDLALEAESRRAALAQAQARTLRAERAVEDLSTRDMVATAAPPDELAQVQRQVKLEEAKRKLEEVQAARGGLGNMEASSTPPPAALAVQPLNTPAGGASETTTEMMEALDQIPLNQMESEPASAKRAREDDGDPRRVVRRKQGPGQNVKRLRRIFEGSN